MGKYSYKEENEMFFEYILQNFHEVSDKFIELRNQIEDFNETHEDRKIDFLYKKIVKICDLFDA